MLGASLKPGTLCKMNPQQPILDWIDAQSARMQSLVTRWANVNSGSDNVAGVTKMTELLREAWAPVASEVIEQIALAPRETIDSNGEIARTRLGPALRIRKRPDAPHRVFLCIHMDTVYPAEGPFQRCDLLDANTLRGPGVADAKGGLAVMLVALEALERSDWAGKIGWEVLINPDEEIGSPGSSPLFEAAARRNHVGMLFEPAIGDGEFVSERAGSANYAIVVRGRSAHAGRDPQA